MQAFVRHTGKVAPLERSNVDTDQIIPKQFLKRIERSGFGQFLFYDWAKDPDFVLNQPRYADASILVAGENFGCGSSREHAAWALQDHGFQAVIAPSFGDIFRNNSLKVGLLPVALPAAAVAELFGQSELTVDLEAQTVTGAGVEFRFDIDEYSRDCLLQGLDEIALTLRQEAAIAAYEAGRPGWLPTVTGGTSRNSPP
jgi:3-isopropylmalate/(R)-2-methylmalate dehydratase small subunit